MPENKETSWYYLYIHPDTVLFKEAFPPFPLSSQWYSYKGQSERKKRAHTSTKTYGYFN